MFSRFTTTSGAIYIRAVDIRCIRDLDDHSILVFEATQGQVADVDIIGTADENMARLREEETDSLIAAEKLRQRQAGGYPAQPIERGKQTMRMVKP